ncbi:hypothetical protein Catovirus_1_469 [Catovirus CTV1]|uniref:Uncharacterized protein n=1 Tax=Catovirus CTV1 TaxID=1977631 RepID=A0A1V0S9Q1_9VIRU|nr:hypothetical protein Catovirus_1_469 [Catovirus CTV1]
MEHITEFITEKSKENIKQLQYNKPSNKLNEFVKNCYIEYSKVFNHTKTELEIKKIDEKYVRKSLEEFYKDLIDNNANQNYDFFKESNNDEVYEISVKGNEKFKFFAYTKDLPFIKKTLHLFNVFSEFIETVPEKKILVSKRIFQNHFNIYLFPNNIERKLVGPKYSPEHLDIYKKTNTAFTTSGVTGSNMIITKREEFTKLLLHELIHLYKLDGTFIENTNVLDDVREKMPFYDDCGEMECVAELLSNIFNCMNLCVIMSNKYKLNNIEQYDLLNSLLNIEKINSMFVVAKILKYFNVNPNELFDYKRPKVELVSPINLYYVLRSVLFFYFDDFIAQNNINLINKNILEINDNIYRHLEKYIKNINDSDYIKVLKQYAKESFGNLNVSYIALDIDLNNIEFDKYIQKGGSKKDYLDKYIKYKSKYLALKKSQ